MTSAVVWMMPTAAPSSSTLLVEVRLKPATTRSRASLAEATRKTSTDVQMTPVVGDERKAVPR
ncbi:hypothetical protein E2562_031300 [Oryza meyeriana var. granulata]|uniref:Uncharacterized protein n=1 Tax=Oryza meyeriana var. granulata TaxID=110450 RepID=A0A6G1CA79_9ORYZ|nr:hypothetical protein E2562_031300 [Oryza meyeriana var. granulata]